MKYYDTEIINIRFHANSLMQFGVYYSPVNQSWLVAFDVDGTLKNLQPHGWFQSKELAYAELYMLERAV